MYMYTVTAQSEWSRKRRFSFHNFMANVKHQNFFVTLCLCLSVCGGGLVHMSLLCDGVPFWASVCVMPLPPPFSL